MVSRIVLGLQGASIPLASDPCRARQLLLWQPWQECALAALCRALSEIEAGLKQRALDQCGRDAMPDCYSMDTVRGGTAANGC